MVNFKALPKNQKAIWIAAAAVLVALIVLLLVLFIPRGGDSEHANYTGPSAAHVEEGSKTPPPTTTAPPDKVTPGTKPTEPPKKDTVTPGTADSKEDYTPEEGTPHYGVTDETYPEPDVPDVEGEEKPVEDFIDDNGRPGEGIHF